MVTIAQRSPREIAPVNICNIELYSIIKKIKNMPIQSESYQTKQTNKKQMTYRKLK